MLFVFVVDFHKSFTVYLSYQWMRNFWKSDPCYAENGVDGSECSFRVYLSEVSLMLIHFIQQMIAKV